MTLEAHYTRLIKHIESESAHTRSKGGAYLQPIDILLFAATHGYEGIECFSEVLGSENIGPKIGANRLALVPHGAYDESLVKKMFSNPSFQAACGYLFEHGVELESGIVVSRAMADQHSLCYAERITEGLSLIDSLDRIQPTGNQGLEILSHDKGPQTDQHQLLAAFWGI